jgi:hypothetical protein
MPYKVCTLDGYLVLRQLIQSATAEMSYNNNIIYYYYYYCHVQHISCD